MTTDSIQPLWWQKKYMERTNGRTAPTDEWSNDAILSSSSEKNCKVIAQLR